jgi:hypothetical protein
MIWIKQQPYPLIEDMIFFYFIGEFSCKWSRIFLYYTSVNSVHNAPCWSPPHLVLCISHSGSKRWGILLGIEISCSQWKAQGCTQGALLLFLLNFGRRGQRGGGGKVSFHFSLVPNVFPNIILQCVLSHFHILRPLEPHPHPLPPSTKKIKIMTRCSTGNEQWLEESSRHCTIFVHINR